MSVFVYNFEIEFEKTFTMKVLGQTGHLTAKFQSLLPTGRSVVKEITYIEVYFQNVIFEKVT